MNRFRFRTRGGGASSIGTDILARIGWNQSLYPLQVFEVAGDWQTDFDPDDYVPNSLFVTTYYVNIARPDNFGNGLTFATAKKSIFSAINAGNLTGQPYKILIETDNGSYPRSDAITSANTIFPTQSFSLVPSHNGVEITDDSKRVTVGQYDVLTWAASTQYPNCYRAPRSNVTRVFNIGSTNAFGDYTEVVNVASASIANNTSPPTFALTGSITNGSMNVVFSADARLAGVVEGMGITGTGIPSGTTLSAISGSGLLGIMSANATATNAAASLTAKLYNTWVRVDGVARTGAIVSGVPTATFLSSVIASGWDNGMTLTGTGIQAGTTISAISGDGLTVTLSANANATNASATITSGGFLYVRRGDAAAVTNANTRAYLIAGAMISLTSANGFTGGKRAYICGLNVEGGSTGVMEITGLTNSVIVTANCSFKYGGAATFVFDNVPISESSGLFTFDNCLFAASWKDGLNAHYTVSTTSRQTFVLTQDCTSRDHGRGSSTSNQGLTGHEQTCFVDVNGNWTYGRGGTVRFIDNSRLAAYGSACRFDLQDSGVAAPTLWNTINTAEFWLTDCVAEGENMGDYALNAFTGTVIYVNNFSATNAPNRNGNIVTF